MINIILNIFDGVVVGMFYRNVTFGFIGEGIIITVSFQ